MKQFILFLFICLLTNCTSKRDEFAIKDAELVTTVLLKSIQTEEYASLKELYSNDFFSDITEEQWIDDLKTIKKKFGGIESYTLTNTEISVENGTSYIILKYEINRTKFPKEEDTFTIVKINGFTKIRRHHVKM